MPDALHLLAIPFNWFVCSLAREELSKRVHFVFLVEVLSLLEFNLYNFLVQFCLERIYEPLRITTIVLVEEHTLAALLLV